MALGSSEKLSLKYHDIFDYPLTKQELRTWSLNTKTTDKVIQKLLKKTPKITVEDHNGFFYLHRRSELIKKRLQREKYSKEKIKIAKKAAKLLSHIPYVKFVGITGALAMNNAGKESDVDLMVITQNNRLWTTRFLCYLLLNITRYKIRKPGSSDEKNKLCINLWLDENDLAWEKKDRNIYTAHEIVQIVPLINKNSTHGKLLHTNKWVSNYWNRRADINREVKKGAALSRSPVERILFTLQYLYMKAKITREFVTQTRAVFHPNNWGKTVLGKLNL